MKFLLVIEIEYDGAEDEDEPAIREAAADAVNTMASMGLLTEGLLGPITVAQMGAAFERIPEEATDDGDASADLDGGATD